MGYRPMKKVVIISLLVMIASILLHEHIVQWFPTFLISYSSLDKFYINLYNVVKNPLYIFSEEAVHNPSIDSSKEKLFTANDLKLFNGKDGSKGLYLAILGEVYDVSKGHRYYGEGGGYEFFAGKDGSRAFVTGEFTEEGLIDDISGLTPQDYIGLEDWAQFYKKDYIYIGKLIGRYFDSNGSPTAYWMKCQEWFQEARAEREEEDREKKLFPPCNSEWSPEEGSRLYCTKKSGGVERDWVGVPRKLFHPGGSIERCACIKNFGPPSHDPTRNPHANRGDLDHPNIREYNGCVHNEPSCHIPNNDFS